MAQRKDAERKKSGWAPVLLVTAAVVVVLAVVLALVVPAVEVNAFLHPKKQPMTTFPGELWLSYEYVHLYHDGVTMLGWYIPAQTPSEEYDRVHESDRTVIFSHNYESNKDMEEINAMYLARDLCDAGYNVLMFDYGGSGSSDGEGYMLGVRETEELKVAIDYVRNEKGCKHVCLMGWAFGAAAALMAADENVDGVVADSSYTDLAKYLSVGLSYWVDVPSFLMPVATHFVRKTVGAGYDTMSPVEAVSRETGVRYFFICGENDRVFPKNSSQVLCAAASQHNNAQLWSVSGAGHIMAYNEQAEAYTERVLAFLNEACAEPDAE